MNAREGTGGRELGRFEERMAAVLVGPGKVNGRRLSVELLRLARQVDHLTAARELLEVRLRYERERVNALESDLELVNGKTVRELYALRGALEDGPASDLLTIAAALVSLERDHRELERRVVDLEDAGEL